MKVQKLLPNNKQTELVSIGKQAKLDSIGFVFKPGNKQRLQAELVSIGFVFNPSKLKQQLKLNKNKKKTR